MKRLNPGESFDTTASLCTNCGKVLDMACCATDADARPKSGDLSICFYCGHMMSWTDDGILRNLNDQEMLEIAGDETVLTVMNALQEAKELTPDRFNCSNNAGSC